MGPNHYVVIGPISIIGSGNAIASVGVLGVSPIPEENLILGDGRIGSSFIGLNVVLGYLLPGSVVISVDPLIAPGRHGSSDSPKVV